MLSQLRKANERDHAANNLVHTTSKNMAGYDFDARFPKMPLYLRRAAVRAAPGAVSGCRSNLKNRIIAGRKGRPPKLKCYRHVMPVFCRNNTYKPGDEPDTVKPKLYRNNDWVWVVVRFRHTDMRYLRKKWTGRQEEAPILERRHGKYFLRFAFTESIKLNDTSVEEQTACAVDIGLNTDAACVIMDPEGTVAARKFIDFPAEKDLYGQYTNAHGGR